MNILLINTFDFGGAAKACLRLQEGLLAENPNTKLLLKRKTNTSQAQTYTFIPLKPSLTQKIVNKTRSLATELKLINPNKYWREAQFLHKRQKGLEAFNFPYTDLDITKSALYQEADIINLHWVAQFLDWTTFFNRNTKPIVWTMHDQNPFLGGEHYAERFLGIDEKGYPLPRKYTDDELKEEKRLLQIKRKALKNVHSFHIVSPSHWLLESSKNSELFKSFPHHHIPYGFPTDIFKPYPKQFCREILGIPQDKIVLLFVADSIHNSRKGYIYLKKALENLSENYQDQVILCAIGSTTNLIQKNQVIEMGKIYDERLLAMTYNAANAFIIPSLEDNLPNTMIESILCGTPVIGFNVGGISDVVINQRTGYLCPEISVQALKETIEKFLANPFVFDRKQIAEEAKLKYDLGTQAESYMNLFNNVLSK
jgi:glycosyltransferase involved in cell wall biosynthesis